MDSQPAAAPDEQVPDLPEQMRVRRDKRERILAEGRLPYAFGYPRTHTLAQVRESWPDLAVDATTGVQVSVTGRVMFLRNTGKLCFATLREGDGTELQVMLSLDRVGELRLADWKSDVDLGDHVGVTGEVITSKRGELSVLADSWEVTSKALRPLPVAHKPLSEETRVRQRYVDLVMREDARRMARMRPRVVQALRTSLDDRGFIEVETPMLQTLQGGAAARPFVTHMNAFDLDLFLRIAPELFLKRCVVGGLERVFEINRNFRNEGVDWTHSPEFSMLEYYAAYEDYNTVAAITKALVQEAAIAVHGSLTATRFDGQPLDLDGEWDRVEMFPAVSAAVGEEITPRTPIERLRQLAEMAGLDPDDTVIHGKLVEELFEHHVVPTLTRPTFVVDFPLDTSPLVREHRSIPGVVEKWDLYAAGSELATGYSELVDPVIQRQRFEEQAKLAAAGDAEAMPLDEDFLRAMEYGMPPMGGVGMGIDRLLAVLTGVGGIRETMLFPLVKPEA